jgi:alpha-ketoglutarate-dependent taurine dioxygenase
MDHRNLKIFLKYVDVNDVLKYRFFRALSLFQLQIRQFVRETVRSKHSVERLDPELGQRILQLNVTISTPDTG